VIVRLLAVGLLGAALGSAPLAAQSLDSDIAAAVADRGWWDETGLLDDDSLDALVSDHGESIGFAYTDRTFAVNDPGQSATPLLAQAVLDRLASVGSPVTTVVLVDGSSAGGASTEFAYSDLVLALDSVDRRDPVASFRRIAESLSSAPRESSVGSAFDGSDNVGSSGGSVFSFGRLLVLAVIVIAATVFWMAYSTRRKGVRVESTADARGDTRAQLAAMSDLIVDLEPRIVIANDAGLRQRFADAGRTYSGVLERADSVTTGHDIADLRLEIAKARWELDVIEAELDGTEPPPEPHVRDDSGSAWDTTRGTGAGPS